MNREPAIRIGLITQGEPRLERRGALTIVHNLLIGAGFHWQKVLSIATEGEIEILSESQGNIHAVNTLGLESYLRSVIGSEMNPSAPAELLKAHAIISRSWAMRKISGETEKSGDDRTVMSADTGVFVSWEESDTHHGFHVCSDDHCQRYQGNTTIQNPEADSRLRDIIAVTRGLVIASSDGEIADARFSKCCGGRTEIFSSCWSDINKDYLQHVADPWCDLSTMSESEKDRFLKESLKDYDLDNDYLNWKADIDGEELRERIHARYNVDLGAIQQLTPIERGQSGRIVRLRIVGSDGSIEVGKTLAIRRLLQANCLRSSWFDVAGSTEGTGASSHMTFHLRGHGWGHGVGLCQIGAARMAFEGTAYREILSFYYPNSKIIKIYD